MTLFGGIGLIVVTVGVYGVLAYSTAQKTYEIGIRMALGAEASDAFGLVVRAGLPLVAPGIALDPSAEGGACRSNGRAALRIADARVTDGSAKG
jgi:hypothetical protein